ncbi:MAG: cobyric acid synthase CobQ, partial [Steroidobacteraceae bacterium]|nr:cobyric acid synthase CobQ [Steroidobacteraceae bacterium]
PWLPAARRLPAEDAVVLDKRTPEEGVVVIAVPMLSRISNFDDFDPLRLEPGVRLVMVPPGEPIPAAAQLIILPGTKATIADLKFLRQQGWDIDIAAHVRRGGHLLGICGGYQMLGHTIADPQGIEGSPERVNGLGYLPVSTELTGDKRVTRVWGVDCLSGAPFEGYEIHSGRTHTEAEISPLLQLSDGMPDGVITADGRIAGCYVHGLFDRAEQRAAWLSRLGASSDGVQHSARVEAALDELASELEKVVNVSCVLEIATGAR